MFGVRTVAADVVAAVAAEIPAPALLTPRGGHGQGGQGGQGGGVSGRGRMLLRGLVHVTQGSGGGGVDGGGIGAGAAERTAAARALWSICLSEGDGVVVRAEVTRSFDPSWLERRDGFISFKNVG